MCRFWKKLGRFMSLLNPEPNLIHIMGCYVLGNANGEKVDNIYSPFFVFQPLSCYRVSVIMTRQEIISEMVGRDELSVYKDINWAKITKHCKFV